MEFGGNFKFFVGQTRERASSEAGFFVCHTLPIGIVAVRPDFLFVTPYLLGLYCSCEAEWFVRHTLPIVIVALMSDFLFVTPYPLGL